MGNEKFMKEESLQLYYEKYLKDIRQVSNSTITHYTQALRTVSKYLVDDRKIQNSIYEIKDIGELEVIKKHLEGNAEFTALDKRGHQMYSTGLNNYIKFAKGEGFGNIKKKIEIFDEEVPIGKIKTRKSTSLSRSSIIKNQSIESAGYQCEYDSNHVTFISQTTKHMYMEGHHAIPMKFQDKFNYSIDIYANIVCLCPICHRLLHYGIASEKDKVLNKIYSARADRLAACGIRIGKADFKELVM